jgi:signal peptidase I
MSFNIDSWPWKFALMGAILVLRLFVSYVANASKQAPVAAPTIHAPRGAQAHKPPEWVQWCQETLDSAAVAVGLVLFIVQPFIVQAFYIPSASMENTLLGPPPGRTSGGDRLLVSKMIYRLRPPQFQDVVVFKAPKAAIAASGSGAHEGDDYIKRCIGTPGDIIEARDRKVFRNGVLINEPYVKWSPVGASTSYDMKIIDGKVYSREYNGIANRQLWNCENVPVPSEKQDEITAAPPGAVPPGKYLVFGDHRNNSSDGHVWGFVPREAFLGKAICVFWPPRRWGVLDRMSFHPRTPAPGTASQ